MAFAWEWPGWRGSSRNGVSQEKDWDPGKLNSKPIIVWKVNAGSGFSSIVIKDQYIYTMGNEGKKDTVFCMDIKTARIKWTYSYKSKTGNYRVPRATPIIENGTLYTLSEYGDVYCFNAEKGKVLWHRSLVKDYNLREPSDGFAGSPFIMDNLLILNAGSSGIAMDKNTGEIVRTSKPQTDTFPVGYASPVFLKYKGKECVALFTEFLNIVEEQTGTVLISYKWGNPGNIVDPVIFDRSKILLSNGLDSIGSVLLDISEKKPKVIWENKVISASFSNFILYDEFLFGCDGKIGNTSLCCMNIKTGKEMWRAPVKAHSILLSDNKLIILDHKGTVFIAEASPKVYKEIARSRVINGVTWTPPVLCRGKLFVRNVKGSIVCIDLYKIKI